MFNKNITDEDIKTICRIITRRIRDDALEPVHQHLTNEEMGALQDVIRSSTYSVLNALRVNKSRKGFDLLQEINSGMELYPFENTTYEVEMMKKMLSGEEGALSVHRRYNDDTPEGLEHLERHRRRERLFSRRGPFSPEEE